MNLLAGLLRWIFGIPNEEDEQAYIEGYAPAGYAGSGTYVDTEGEYPFQGDFPSPADAASLGGGGGYGYGFPGPRSYAEVPLAAAEAGPLGGYDGGGGAGGYRAPAPAPAPYYGPVGAGAILGGSYAQPKTPSWYGGAWGR